MLLELRVENLLLIERAELRLEPGLTAITGETGAGKTVLAWGVAGYVVSFIAPHTLTARALVVAPSDTLTVENTSDRDEVSVSTDGEVKLMATPLHYRALPRALNVFAPAS